MASLMLLQLFFCLLACWLDTSSDARFLVGRPFGQATKAPIATASQHAEEYRSPFFFVRRRAVGAKFVVVAVGLAAGV